MTENDQASHEEYMMNNKQSHIEFKHPVSFLGCTDKSELIYSNLTRDARNHTEMTLSRNPLAAGV